MNDITLFASNAPALTIEDIEYAKRFVTEGGVYPPSISLKGNRFNFVRNGEVAFVAPTLTLDVIVLGARKTASRVWYAVDYDTAVKTNTKSAPSCWSSDDRVPAGPAEKRPHVQGPAGARPVTACSECPMNVKGSSNNGQGKACSYKQTLVVAPPDGSSEIWRLDVSGMGAFGDSQPEQNLRSWKDYRDWLATPRQGFPHGVPLHTILTRLSFDNRQSVPVLRFGVATLPTGGAAWLTASQVAAARARGDMPDVLEILSSAAVPDTGLPAPSALPAPTLHSGSPSAPSAPTAPSAPVGFVAPPPPAPAVPVVAAVAPGINHPDIPEDVRVWAAHPAVTAAMIHAYLEENYPEALEVPAPVVPPAPVAPAAPTAPPARKRRTKAEIEAAQAPRAEQAPTAPSPMVQAEPSGFAPQVSAPVAPIPPAATAGGGSLSDKLGKLLGNFDDAA